MADLTLRRCRLPGRFDELVDIAIEGNRITAISPQLPSSDTPSSSQDIQDQDINIDGKLVSPPFVESHIHLDSALTAGEPRWNSSGTLFEGIEIWRERKQSLTLDDVQDRAIAALKLMAGQGTLFVRSHADVSESTLTALKGLLAVKEKVKDWVTLQIVAFPQDGLYGSPQNAELMEEALRLGADAVGGIPHYEMTREDGVQSVHTIFELAQRYDRLIDIHCDEIDDEQSRFLEVMAACAIRHDYGHRTTASHTTAFGSYNDAYAFKLMGMLQRAHLNFIANPLINITLQGRTDTYPKRRGVTRVKELWQRGLNVSLGNDCIQDPWYSLGTGNLLDVASMAVHVCQMTGMDEIAACYDMVTTHGAQTLNLGDAYGLAVGRPANLIVLDAVSPYDAIRRRATVTHVIARGQILAQTVPTATHWHGTEKGKS
ncbi:MAG: cytosine deaminase [Cyanobacteria bacterium J06632_22]